MNENLQNQNNSLAEAARQRLIGLLRKPQQERREKKPANKRWIAYLGFNFAMFFIDLVSALTVGALTSALYGVMTFLAGFLALLLHENLFTNPHAGMTQKWIAIGGMVISILSTLAIGVIAALLNVTQIVGTLLPVATLELAVTITLVVITVVHGLAWGVYYFIDDGHRAEMSALVSRAYREQQLKNFEDAQKDIETVMQLDKQLRDMGADRAELVALSYQQHTGKALYQAPTPLKAAAHAVPVAEAAPVSTVTMADPTEVLPLPVKASGNGHKPTVGD